MMITSVIDKNLEKKFSGIVFHVFSLLCLVLTFFASLYLYKTIQSQIKQSLLDRVNTVAQALDPEEFRGLTAVAEDEKTEAYKKIKKKLININEINSDSRFFYIVTLREGFIYFLADSEYENADYSPPGLIYPEATTVFKSMFLENPIDYFEIDEGDRWGRWASAYAVMPQGDNPVKFVIGIDVAANDYIMRPIYFAAIPYIIFFGAYLVIFFILKKRRSEINLLYTKNRFLAIASHELRAPLTGIRWSSEILKGDKKLPLVEKKVATDIYNSSVNLIRIINDLLDVFTIESKLVSVKKFVPMDMLIAVKESIKQLSSFALEKNIFITLNSDNTIARSSLMVNAEESHMYTVLTNIISNAIKYSYPNSEVIVSVGIYKKMVRIRVKDTGIGIPKQALDKVTEGFYRAENALRLVANGTGLGLYLVDTITRFHKGTLSIDSTLDKGTVVTLDLPLLE